MSEWDIEADALVFVMVNSPTSNNIIELRASNFIPFLVPDGRSHLWRG